MKPLNNKNGFNLIELIVVMIIVGILVAIALPNVLGNIEESKGSTALQTMTMMENPIETCAAQNNEAPGLSTDTHCLSLATIGLTQSDNNFTYQLAYVSGSMVNNNISYTITALENNTTNDAVILTRSSTGSFTCSTTSPTFQNVCS